MNKLKNHQGWTLVEMLVTTGIVAIAGITFFWVLSTMTTLAAKNTAVNQSHTEARLALTQAVNDIRNSIAAPTLVDSNFNLVPIQTPYLATGVVYQLLVGGPGIVSANVTAASKLVTVTFYAPTGDPDLTTDLATNPTPPAPIPQVGNRLIIPCLSGYGPDYGEFTITAVSGTWTNYPTTASATFVLTLSTGIPVALDVTSTNSATKVPNNFPVFCSSRTALMVNGTDLRYYPNVANGNYVTLTRNVVPVTYPAPATTPPPIFSIADPNGVPPTTPPPSPATPFPANAFQSLQVGLATTEPRATNRGYQNINFQTLITVPIRNQLAKKVP